jgi:hypothetical protein
MNYKTEQWIFLKKGKEEYVGVVVDNGSDKYQDLYFSGVNRCGNPIAIPLSYIDEWDVEIIKTILEKENEKDASLCCVCHKNYVDSRAGFDTCELCSQKT